MHPKALLDTAASLLAEVLRFDHAADAVLARAFKDRSVGPRERAQLAEAVFRVLRRKSLFERGAAGAPAGGSLERRLAILGLAASQDGVVDAALTEPERAWLAAVQGQDLTALPEVLRHNLPQWLADRLKKRLGADEFWRLVQALEQPAAVDVRVNALSAKREAVQQQLAAEGVPSQATPASPWGLRVDGKPSLTRTSAWRNGAIEVQDEGSQLLALLVDAKRGEMVADFCAGAGGKTLALGAAMRNTGRLYAFDTSAHRLEGLKPRLQRSGLTNVHPTAIAHERDARLRTLHGKLDCVLVDAPCTGLGTLRRHPDLKWRTRETDLAEKAVLQQAILASAAQLLKPGGRLVYATCSLLDEENERVAAAFTAGHKDFAPLPVAAELERLKVPQAASLCSGPAESPGAFLRLWPQRQGTDGFFAAIWQKRS